MDSIKKFTKSTCESGTKDGSHQTQSIGNASQTGPRIAPGANPDSGAGAGVTTQGGAPKKDDPLDKGIDLFQQHVLREGPQTNESEEEKRKDEMISGAVKKGYKGVTGKELFGDRK